MFLIITIISFTIFSLSHCCINNESSIISTGISEKDIEYILDIHNKLRANVALGNVEDQQKAKNMRIMRWDDDLATLAQDWSENCVFKHDYNMTDPQDRFQVGQNLAITKHTLLENEEPDFNFMFDLWADEKDNFNYSRLLESDVLRTGNNQILHYTQIVAARTYLIGCGYTLFKEDGFFPYGRLYVCNYGPIGNIYDTYPYEERNDDELLCDDLFEDSEIYGLCEPKGTNSSSIIEVTEPEYYESTETNLIEKNEIILSEQNTETNSIELNSMTVDEQTSKSNFTEKNSTILDEETNKNGNLI